MARGIQYTMPAYLYVYMGRNENLEKLILQSKIAARIMF
jgi:hypothetical protein